MYQWNKFLNRVTCMLQKALYLTLLMTAFFLLNRANYGHNPFVKSIKYSLASVDIKMLGV